MDYWVPLRLRVAGEESHTIEADVPDSLQDGGDAFVTLQIAPGAMLIRCHSRHDDKRSAIEARGGVLASSVSDLADLRFTGKLRVVRRADGTPLREVDGSGEDVTRVR